MPQVEIIMPPQTQESVRPTRIAAYCRVSGKSDDQLNSFYAQVRHYTTCVSEIPNSELVDVYADEGISGSTIEKRDDFKRMLADCDKGKIDRIITKTVSRFARNTLECLETVRNLKLKGISVYFEEQKIDTQNMGNEMMITMFGSIAQSEARSISKNLKMMNRKRMENGEYISRMAPYGFQYEDRTYTIIIDRALVVRRIFRDYLKGYGTAAIANRLNSEEVPPPDHAKRWRSNTIYGILCNEKYIGDTCYQKTYREDDLPFTKRKNRGELQRYYAEGTHMGIVERNVFQQVQALMSFKSNPAQSTALPKTAFSEIIRCGCCGGTFRRKLTRGKAYWICYHHNIHKDYCDMPAIPESEIEDAYIALFNKLKANMKVIITPTLNSLKELDNAQRRENTRLRDIDLRLVELNDKKHLLTRLQTSGIMDDITYRKEVVSIDQEMSTLQAERKKMLDADDGLQQINQIKELQDILMDTPSAQDFDPETFASIIENATVIGRSNIEFKLLGGFQFTERLERGAG